MSAPIELIDTHAHLGMTRFEGDLDKVVERAQSSGVTRIICAGIDLPSSVQAVQIAQQYPAVFAAVGIHPEDSQGVTQQDIEVLARLARNPRVVAIGEIGLDYYRDYGPRNKQIEVLQWQLKLASSLRLPVVIHSREADLDLLPILGAWQREYPAVHPGVIHCFNGSICDAQAYIELGFYLSLGGYIGYPSAKVVRTVVGQLPIESLLLETDSPFLPPQSHRGERNEPAYLVETANEFARSKGLSLAEIAETTTSNARQLFAGLYE